MRFVLLDVLLGLYALLGLVFAVWAVLGRNAEPGTAMALPLPEWIMWLAAAIDLGIAVAGFLSLAVTRAIALSVHAVVTLVAGVVMVRHLLDAGQPHGIGSNFEMLAKTGVHAAMFCYWLRSRAVAERLRRRLFVR